MKSTDTDKEHGQKMKTTLLHKDENESKLIIRAVSGCTTHQPRRRPMIVRKSIGTGIDGSAVGGDGRGGRVDHA